QSKTLYDAYLAVRESDEWSKLELAQQRIIELCLRSATLSGVELEGEEVLRRSTYPRKFLFS
ncbi:hypothetical protein PC128_g27525, partial [Phytophthora cactorum]